LGVEEGIAARPIRATSWLLQWQHSHGQRRAWTVLATGALLLLFGIAAVALYAFFFARIQYPYAGDGPAYIEAARSLLAGQPLLYSVPFGYDNEWQIFQLWPPGYPTLIAIVASTGLDAAVVALWLTRLSLVFLPLVSYWAIHRAVGIPIAIAAALLSVSAPGILRGAHFVTSDAPFALAVMVSLGFLLRGLASDTGVTRWSRLLAVAGLLAGAALTIRNSGVALIAAEGATIAALWLARDGSFARLFCQGLSFASGLAVGLLLLMVWNLVAFGELRPYFMGPSTVGVRDNIEHLTYSLVFDLLPRVRLQGEVALGAALLGLLGILAVVAIGIAQLRTPDPRDSEPRRDGRPPSDAAASRERGAFMIFAACYGAAAAITTIAARSRYEWGELIGARHVAQFDWLLVAAAFCAMAPWLGQRRAFTVALLGITACLLGVRAWHFGEVYAWTAAGHSGNHPDLSPPNRAAEAGVSKATQLAFSRSAAAAAFVTAIPSHCDIISNVAGVIQVNHSRRARQLWNRKIRMEDFSNLRKPSVLIFAAMPQLEIDSLQPPGLEYRTIRDPLFVAFEPMECRPVATPG
jgi:hypothetical protein